MVLAFGDDCAVGDHRDFAHLCLLLRHWARQSGGVFRTYCARNLRWHEGLLLPKRVRQGRAEGTQAQLRAVVWCSAGPGHKRLLFDQELVPNNQMQRDDQRPRDRGGYDDRDLRYEIRRLREEVVKRLGNEKAQDDAEAKETPLLPLAMEKLHEDRLFDDDSRLKLFV